MKHLFPKNGTLVLVGSLACMGFLSACGNAGPRYYALRPSCQGIADMGAGAPANVPGAMRNIEVLMPAVGEGLDRDRIVRSVGGYRMNVADDSAWSEPLAPMAGRTFARDLGCALPGRNVYLQNDDVPSALAMRIGLTLVDFSLDKAGHAVIEGKVSVDGAHVPAFIRPVYWKSDKRAYGVEGEARLLSQGLAEIARATADDIARLSSGGSVSGHDGARNG